MIEEKRSTAIVKALLETLCQGNGSSEVNKGSSSLSPRKNKIPLEGVLHDAIVQTQGNGKKITIIYSPQDHGQALTIQDYFRKSDLGSNLVECPNEETTNRVLQNSRDYYINVSLIEFSR